MKVKGNKKGKIVLLVGLSGATLLAYGVFSTPSEARVGGKCENCHTMHNSQDGQNNTQVHVGTNAGWNTTTNQLTNGNSFTERAELLRSDCVGCHSATDASKTIITDASGNKVPIVYNLGGIYPANALAGGNFALNSGAANIYGHNVAGIATNGTLDTTIGSGGAPGTGVTCGTTSCHDSMTFADAATEIFTYNGIDQGQFNGCKACHNKVSHHSPSDPSYRFLGGHGGGGSIPGVDIVVNGRGLYTTFEEPNWETTPNASTHNFYMKSSGAKDTMGDFCAGCHQDFHAPGGVSSYSIDNGGDANTENPSGLIVANSPVVNPWLRHPTNVNIPLDPLGEYAAMDSADYSPTIPVAQDPTNANKDIINFGDQVMCLSCHRAHASQYPDALRFNYTQMNAHAGAGAGVGCFYCHTTKDDV